MREAEFHEVCVELDDLRKGIRLHGFRGLQRPVGRQKDDAAHAARKDGIPEETQNTAQKQNRLHSSGVHKADKHIQYRKQTEHEPDVIVAPERHKQRCPIQAPVGASAHTAAVPNAEDLLDALHNQRKHRDGVQPHDIEIVPDHEERNRIHRPERRCKKPRLRISAVQIPGHGSAAECDLHQDQVVHEVADIRCRDKANQEIQRACQIIGIGCPEVIPQPCRKGVQQRGVMHKLLMKFCVEWQILVKRINDQNRPVAKWPDADLYIPDEHDQSRDREPDQEPAS